MGTETLAISSVRLFRYALGSLLLLAGTALLAAHGLAWLGATPNWALGAVVPGGWLLPLQTVVVLLGFGAALFVGQRIGRRDFDHPATATRAFVPWLVVLLGLAVAALATFNLPMEMRGSMLMGG